jgi:hypothetical protein
MRTGRWIEWVVAAAAGTTLLVALEWPDLSAPQECGQTYASALGRGQAEMEKANFLSAAVAFEEALKARCFEIPNYVLVGRLAEARCRAGQEVIGRGLLEDYSCMLAVDAGEKHCYLDTQQSSAKAERTPGLTDRCFKTMCSDLFLSYYDHPSTAQLARVNRLRASAKQVARMCGGTP